MYTLKEIAVKTQIPFRTLQSRARRENWKVCGASKVNHKPARMYAIEALPQELRNKITAAPAAALPAVVQHTMQVPEKARRIALARVDLVHHWLSWRKEHSYIANAKADANFIVAFNSGLIFTTLKDSLGTVSLSTLYRWNSILEGTLDWTRLVPAYRTTQEKTGAVLTPDESKFFMNALLKPSKPSIGTAYRLAKYALEQHSLPLVHSLMTFRRYAEDFKRVHMDVWTQVREGEKALVDNVLPFIRRDMTKLTVGQLLVADGHRLNFQVINPETGKPCRATVLGYLDAKSYYLAGYEIMIEENTQCIASALRNAIINLGKIPQICLQDNGRAFRSRFFTATESLDSCGFLGLFGRLGIHAMFSKPYNARAKIIEGWWSEFGNTFERLMPSFTGASIEDKPAWMLRNEKWHKNRHNDYVPTIREVIARIDSWLDFAGKQECPYVPGKTRRQVFEEGRGPGVDVAALDDLMMSVKVARLGRNGVRLFGEEYFNEALCGLRTEVIVRYSLQDRNTVRLYLPDGQYLCQAERVEKISPIATVTGTDEEREGLKESLALQQRLKRETLVKSDKAISAMRLGWDADGKVESKDVQEVRAEVRVVIPAGKPITAVTHVAPAEETASGARPVFMDLYERFDWLLKNGANSAEDQEFMAEYKLTDEYKMFYKSHNC